MEVAAEMQNLLQAPPDASVSHRAAEQRERERVCGSLATHQTAVGKRRDAHARSDTHREDSKAPRVAAQRMTGSGWRMLSSRSVAVECG